MSELVKNVRGIIETHIAACEPPDAIARAAIAAVADWLNEHHKRLWLESENHASSALRYALEAKE